MAERDFERKLSEICSPTLLGEKASGLLSLDESRFDDLSALVASYNRRFGDLGLCFRILRHRKGRGLVLVYRPELLKRSLSNVRIQRLLTHCGYPAGGDLKELLAFLSRRLSEDGSFPHEIGAFLDYPPEDIEGFIKYRGGCCKYCGCWKVYGDVESAKARFACFEECRRLVSGALDRGLSLSELLPGAGISGTGAHTAA